MVIAHVNHCSVLTAECDFSETPGGVYIEREANRTMHGKSVSSQPKPARGWLTFRRPNQKSEVKIFSLATSNRVAEISSEAGRGVVAAGCSSLPLPCIVCTSSNCDAVIRRPGRIWGVWESHERNDAMLGNQFLAGDNTSRIRTCFIKQCWL